MGRSWRAVALPWPRGRTAPRGTTSQGAPEAKSWSVSVALFLQGLQGAGRHHTSSPCLRCSISPSNSSTVPR